MYKRLIKPFLFLLDPERAHSIASLFLKLAGIFPFNYLISFRYRNKSSKKYSCMGLDFPSRLGLAAGFDKNADLYKGLFNFGFGFVEIGTVTPKAQPGNQKPRLFRIPSDGALINRMGFNNDGIEKVINKLRIRNRNAIIGGNIGKNKATPNEEAYKDYEICFEKLFNYVDYFTINVSSPNTPGLRELQDKEPLRKLLEGLQFLNKKHSPTKPILLKIAPDLTNHQLDEVVEIIQETKIEGVIAGNTTIGRTGLQASNELLERMGSGGLSGAPLKERALEIVSYLSTKSNASFTIIGVGGISSPQDALDMIKAGADLIQVYTGFIYGGPEMVKKINRALELHSN